MRSGGPGSTRSRGGALWPCFDTGARAQAGGRFSMGARARSLSMMPSDRARLVVLSSDVPFCKLPEVRPKWNLVRALGVERKELAHSNVLASLLTPTAAHGLGDRFLRALLKHLGGLHGIAALVRPDIHLADARVHRERDGIDLLLELPS